MTYSLSQSLALSARCLRGHSAAFSQAPDPLRLNLPSLTSGTHLPKPKDLKVIAAMYQQAELEQLGIIPLVEVLVQYRYQLGLQDLDAARRLEDFHMKARDWYDRRARENFFARLFGQGPAAANRKAVAVNHDFQRLFAVFCQAAVRYRQAFMWRGRADIQRDAALRFAARQLLRNLAQRQIGSAVFSGRKIEAQLRAAVAILSHRGMQAHFGARNMWDVLRRILGEDLPDLNRITTRAQSGLTLLHRTAALLPTLLDHTDSKPLLSPEDALYLHAARWLQATGLAVKKQPMLAGGV